MPKSINTQSFRTEHDLVRVVARYLRNQAFRLQMEEVPFYEYRMDMYGYSRRKDLTVAVELKLTRWSRAVEQALLYQLCSDLVYIAMPSRAAARVDLGLLERHGLGLLSVNTYRCHQVVAARPSPVLRRHYRNEYLAMVHRGV